MQNTLHFHWKEPQTARNYRAAVSMHGHTNCSKEGLYFILEYAAKRPLLRGALASQERKARTKSAITVNFFKAFWTPPLTPVLAFQLERNQIAHRLGIDSMISITDHDTIEAPLALRALPESSETPISMEWSVPFQNTIFHLGLHNLPPAGIESLMSRFAEFATRPSEERLDDILGTLDSDPDILIVLNHPMWDLAGIGRHRHVQAATRFVAAHGRYFHAFELGGLRDWEENRAVIEFAQTWNQLVIGGGDRHGAEPSAVLNLTNARCFAEFVHEIRKERHCEPLFMPQYREPLVLRILQSLLDVVREYPTYPEGSRRWDERVFHPNRDGVVCPLATLWIKPPAFIEAFFSTVRLLELPAISWAARLALATPKHQMQFTSNQGQEAASKWGNSYGSRSSPARTTKSMGWRTPAANLRRSRENANSTS